MNNIRTDKSYKTVCTSFQNKTIRNDHQVPDSQQEYSATVILKVAPSQSNKE